MAASGALELIAAVEMLRGTAAVPTRNLEAPDHACGGVRHAAAGDGIEKDVVIKNSFALGGVNSTIVVRRCVNE